MWQEISRGRIFGHPIHSMLVHFPIALFSAGFIFDVVGVVLHQPILFKVSFYVILMGVAGGLLAGLFGFIDYIKLKDRPTILLKASWHGAIQFVVVAIFAVILGLKSQAYPDIEAPNLLQFIIMGVTVVAMLVGNYLGGELVFVHKIGIND